MTRPRRRVAGLAATLLLALSLVACSDADDEVSPDSSGPIDSSVIEDSEASQDATPDEAGAGEPIFDQIPRAARRAAGLDERLGPGLGAFLPRSEISDDGVSVTDRRVPFCADAGAATTQVDRDVKVFAWSARRVDGYVVARQATLYPNSAVAGEFARQWVDQAAGCQTRFDGGTVASSQRTAEPGSADFLDLPGEFTTVVAEERVGVRSVSTLYVDAITRRDNAVVLTRVLDPDYRDVEGVVVAGNDRGPEGAALLEELRTQVGASSDLLTALQPAE